MQKEPLVQLIGEGLSQKEIADKLQLSKSTVRYWLKKYGLTTQRNKFNKKSITDEERRARNVRNVTARRRKLTKMAKEYKGGQCFICGYNRCLAALEFHHIDPTEKEFSIAQKGHTRSWERIKKELEKCVLLCANCHREVHAGLLNVP